MHEGFLPLGPNSILVEETLVKKGAVLVSVMENAQETEEDFKANVEKTKAGTSIKARLAGLKYHQQSSLARLVHLMAYLVAGMADPTDVLVFVCFDPCAPFCGTSLPAGAW